MYVACCVVFVYVHLSLSDLLLKKGFMFVNSFFVGIFVDLKVREGAFLGGEDGLHLHKRSRESTCRFMK